MMERLRVVNLGLPKSGTTTVGEALVATGLKTSSHRVMPEDGLPKERHGQFIGHMMYEGYFGKGDPLAHLDAYDGLGEISVIHAGKPAFPQMDAAVIEAVAMHHPGVRFVASWREPAAISNSMLRWNNLVARLQRNSLPGLPVGYGEKDHERERWIEAHYSFLDTVFGGDEIYLQLDVKQADAPEQLGKHIGREIKWWGQANKNPVTQAAGDVSAA